MATDEEHIQLDNLSIRRVPTTLNSDLREKEQQQNIVQVPDTSTPSTPTGRGHQNQGFVHSLQITAGNGETETEGGSPSNTTTITGDHGPQVCKAWPI